MHKLNAVLPVSKSAYRQLLTKLLDDLGPGWYRASPTAIYRTDSSYLVQCISCQSSNFSRDYVPATFVQVLARRSDELRFDFGGRLTKPQTGDLWLEATNEPPAAEVLHLASEQAAVPFGDPLTIDALAMYLDGSNRASFEFSQWWSAGVVYGLCGRRDDARDSLGRAQKLLEKLKSKLDKAALSKAVWISDALADIKRAIAGLDSQEQFSARCRSIAKTSASNLGLKAFG